MQNLRACGRYACVRCQLLDLSMLLNLEHLVEDRPWLLNKLCINALDLER